MISALLLAMALPAPTNAVPAVPCLYRGGAVSVAVPGHPFAAQPTADGCWLFVSLSGDGRAPGGIAVLHNEGGRFGLAGTVPLRAGAFGLALTHDENVLLVPSGDEVVAYDVAKLKTARDNAELGRIVDGSGSAPVYIAVSNDDRLAFVSDEHAARLTVIDLHHALESGFGKSAVIGRIPQGQSPAGLALSRDGRRLYAINERIDGASAFRTRCHGERRGGRDQEHGEGALSIIDVGKAATDPAHATMAFVPAGCNPVRVALSADEKTAWVTARGENTVYSIDVERLDAKERTRHGYAVGNSPVGVIAQPTSGHLWISNSNRFSQGAGTIQDVPTDGRTATTIQSGRFPRDLRFLPDGQTLVVAVYGAEVVQFVPIL